MRHRTFLKRLVDLLRSHGFELAHGADELGVHEVLEAVSQALELRRFRVDEAERFMVWFVERLRFEGVEVSSGKPGHLVTWEELRQAIVAHAKE